MKILYRNDIVPNTPHIIAVYESSGINRPTSDNARIQQMYDHSNLIITAWDGDILVGIARSLTDFCYCCYLADLAVRQEYKMKGIGKTLIDLTKKSIGEQTTLLLLSAPTAMDYYPKVGFQGVSNGFIINRSK